VSSRSSEPNNRIAWFSALCDDGYDFLGVPDPSLQAEPA
jgi:hypothetical protein